MIKIGQNIGAFNTILLIFITAVIGIYFAEYRSKHFEIKCIKYVQKSVALFEMISGASIALQHVC